MELIIASRWFLKVANNQSLVILHSHNEAGTGREAFDMGRNSVIFLHPTLRHLTVSCLDINEDIVPNLSASKRKTRLQSLTFDECNITASALTAILAVPNALEELTIGERMYHLSRDGHAPLGRFPAAVFNALALQKDTIHYVKHIGGFGLFGLVANSPSLPLDILPNLRKLEVGSSSILARFLYQSNRSTSMLDLHLRIIHSYSSEPDPLEVETTLLPSVLLFIRQCPHLDLVLDCAGGEPDSGIAESLQLEELPIWKEILAHLRSDASEATKSSNKRRLRILISRRDGLIPPYMYGEKEPVEEVIFDSDSYNVRS